MCQGNVIACLPLATIGVPLFHYIEGYNGEEHGKYYGHLHDMPHRVYPYFLEEAVACGNLHKGPEDYHRRKGEAYVPAPCAYAQLFAQHKHGGCECHSTYGVGDRVGTAKEHRVVAEHKEEVQPPHHDVPFHEDHDACMMCHRAELDVTLYAAVLLYPLHEVASCT